MSAPTNKRSSSASAPLLPHEQPPPPDAPGGPEAPSSSAVAPPPVADELPPSYKESVSTKHRRGVTVNVLDTSGGNLPGAGLHTAHAPGDSRALGPIKERPLPKGWIRQFDPDHSRWYYVDTDHAKGPRSTWNHPCFDQTYLNSLDLNQRAIAEWDNILYSLRQVGVGISLAIEPEQVRDAREAVAADAALVEVEAQAEAPAPDTDTAARSKRFKRFSTKFKSSRAQRHEKRKAKKMRNNTFAEAQSHLAQAFIMSRNTGIPQLVQRDVDDKAIVVLPPRPHAHPNLRLPPDPFQHLIADKRLKCIRTPVNDIRVTGIHPQGAQNRTLPVVTGIVGGLILGALLL